jgi:hypothetical protein
LPEQDPLTCHGDVPFCGAASQVYLQKRYTH